MLGLGLKVIVMGPVVQSIVSRTTSLRGHLLKCIPTTLSNTLLFFNKKGQCICNINVLNFNET